MAYYVLILRFSAGVTKCGNSTFVLSGNIFVGKSFAETRTYKNSGRTRMQQWLKNLARGPLPLNYSPLRGIKVDAAVETKGLGDTLVRAPEAKRNRISRKNQNCNLSVPIAMRVRSFS
jgi:hypothetical protein